jgi:hypothetical protein
MAEPVTSDKRRDGRRHKLAGDARLEAALVAYDRYDVAKPGVARNVWVSYQYASEVSDAEAPRSKSGYDTPGSVC